MGSNIDKAADRSTFRNAVDHIRQSEFTASELDHWNGTAAIRHSGHQHSGWSIAMKLVEWNDTPARQFIVIGGHYIDVSQEAWKERVVDHLRVRYNLNGPECAYCGGGRPGCPACDKRMQE